MSKTPASYIKEVVVPMLESVPQIFESEQLNGQCYGVLMKKVTHDGAMCDVCIIGGLYIRHYHMDGESVNYAQLDLNINELLLEYPHTITTDLWDELGLEDIRIECEWSPEPEAEVASFSCHIVDAIAMMNDKYHLDFEKIPQHLKQIATKNPNCLSWTIDR